MKSILLKKARIIDSSSSHHMKVRDVLIEKGIITDIKSKIPPPKKTTIITSPDLHISQGWIDIGCFNGEPGQEHREDLVSLKNAGANGGYVGLAPFSTTRPSLDSKGQLDFLLSKNIQHPVQIYPIATLTQDANGKDMSEIMDLWNSGAVCFSDGNSIALSDGQLRRSLEYLKTFDGSLIIPVTTSDRIGTAQVNEGSASIKMGLEGAPGHWEQISLNHILHQIEYTGGRAIIHNLSISTAADQLKKVNDDQVISCTVAAMNLAHSESILSDWDTNYKVLPPLRSEKDRKKLCREVEKGNLNIIVSNHVPQAQEDKDEPFGLSPFGAVTLETVYPSLLTYANEISHERIIECLTSGPRSALGLENNKVAVGNDVSLTFFDPSVKQKIDLSTMQSKSNNNPYIGLELEGKVLGIINKNQIIINE